jgi:hypothetical protein
MLGKVKDYRKYMYSTSLKLQHTLWIGCYLSTNVVDSPKFLGGSVL